MTRTDASRFVIEASREVESTLEDKFGAEGSGLRTKADAVADVLGERVVEQICFLADVRGKLGNESERADADVPLAHFERTYQEVMHALDATAPVRGVEEKRARRRARERGRAGRHAAPSARVSRSRVVPLIALGVIALLAYALLASRSSSVQHRPATSGKPTAR
jgi:hypothetical protein